MSEFIEFVFGIIILGLMLISGFSMLSAMFSKKPVRRRRNYRNSNRYYKGRGRGYGYYRTPPITSRTPRKYSGKSYISNPDPDTFMVYFLENEKLGALKLGVGSWGRINEFLDSRVEPSYSAERIGWKLLRAAKFSTTESEYDLGREQAYEAERRAHFYWRYVKRHPRKLEKEEMGFSLIEVYRQRKFEPTKGFTETAPLGEVCEQTTWNYVLKSPGLKSEHVPEGARALSSLDEQHLNLELPPGYQEAQIKRIRHRADGSITRTQISDEERFWSKIEKTDTCWNWKAATTNSGYGLGRLDGSIGAAHRIVWTLETGSDPGLFFMENKCGKRSCVNPQHWDISLRRRSTLGEIRVSAFSCTTPNCFRPAYSMTKPGPCEPCRQRAKRDRRKARISLSLSRANQCSRCGLEIERRGSPTGTDLCTVCRNP
jgi:hypothetical protein